MTTSPIDRAVRARYFNGGFLWRRRLRRILHLAGIDLALGPVRAGDAVAVWGLGQTAHRGTARAAATGAPLIRVEDAFLRSLHPGRAGEPPLGLVIDRRGAYFDARQPSDLEHILATDPFEDGALIGRAHAAMDRMARNHLTKYAAVDTHAAPPPPGYVLVVDQTRDDASVRLGGADASTFREMLLIAREEHPKAPIVIKTHPETNGGLRPGHYGPGDVGGLVQLETRPLSPWRLFEGARAVYTVTSQLGFEAIFAGHRPVVFGQPFYAGWGLTDDRAPIDRRTRRLTRAQLFAGAMIRYPLWYDPYHDRLCPLEDAMASLEAQARAWREDSQGYVACGMRLWKRPHLQRMLGGQRRLRFADPAPVRPDRPVAVWANRETEEMRQACARAQVPLLRVEDGFLRSRGLGAQLVPPLSLVLDPEGIYYDPTRPSRLERLILAAAKMPPQATARVQALIAQICALRLSKYNLGHEAPALPAGKAAILVVGQVEDDASIQKGACVVRTNAALLAAARQAHPDRYLIYKPHPDVTAGLRAGALPPDAAALADAVLPLADIAALFAHVAEVWTITSAAGFEALLRGVPVTCLGAPFYAGWGLTRDLGRVPARRAAARPDVAQLAHAALIDYPRYVDPLTGQPCPPEVAVARLAQGHGPTGGLALRGLAKAQGLLASWPWLWR